MLVCKVWPLIRNPSGCKDTKKSATSKGNRGFLAFLSYLAEFPECHTLIHLDILQDILVVVARKTLHQIELFEGGTAHQAQGLMNLLAKIEHLQGLFLEFTAIGRTAFPVSHNDLNVLYDKPFKVEADYFLYYSLKINGRKYWANVKMHKYYKGEVLYTIEDYEPEDIIKGKPKKKNDGMR